jgi:hypothetical protein
LALLWYASLRIAATNRAVVSVAAKALFTILTCLACIAIGFFLPMAPGIRAVIGGALWAGLLATAGALVGMALSEGVLARIEPRTAAAAASARPTKARETTQPRA